MMSVLGQIFTDAGVEKEQLSHVVKLLRENPMAAMMAVQELKLGDDVMQKIMATVMMNPDSIEELAMELGLTQEDLDAIKNQIQGK
jgi:hypothetical protein